jgi:hypothetical protein
MVIDTQAPQGRSARDDKPRKTAVATVTPIPDGCGASHNTPGNTAEPDREQADRQAIERCEDDGMIVHHSATSSAHNARDRNAIAER